MSAHPGDVLFRDLARETQVELARAENVLPHEYGPFFDQLWPKDRWEILWTLNGRTGEHDAEVARIAEKADSTGAFDALVTESLGLPRLLHTSAAAVEATKPEWIWERWLEAHSLHIMAARQGSGKSTAAAWFAARSSRGDLSLGGRAIRCAILSLEEPAERIAGRLEAAGADMTKVDILHDVEAFTDEGVSYRRPWRLPADCSTLERKMAELATEFVIIDGIGYSVTGKQDYQEIGSALSALAGVCERLRVAVLGLTHTPKGSSDAATPGIGSTAWTAIPRIIMVLGTDPNDDTRRVLQVSPSTNYRQPDHGMGFRIANYEPYECGYVTDITESDVEAADLVTTSTPEERSDRADAREWLTSKLGSDRLDSKLVKADWRKEGGSTRTLQRARNDEHVVVEKEGFGASMVSWWSLPQPVVPGGSNASRAVTPGTNGNTATDQALFTEDDPSEVQACLSKPLGTTGTTADLENDHDGHRQDAVGRYRMADARRAAGVALQDDLAILASGEVF